jgi:HEAT repeat protein
LKKDLHGSNIDLAAEAAEAFGWLRIESEIPYLIDLLGHDEEWLRDRASFALSRMPRSVAPILMQKVADFEGPSFEHAVKAFVRMKQTAVMPLLDLLLSSNEKAQDLAHKALCQIKFPLDQLNPALNHASNAIRVAAIDILGKSRNFNACGLLLEHARHFSQDLKKVEIALVRLARHFPKEMADSAAQPMPYLILQALAKAQAEIGWDYLRTQIEQANSSELPQLLLLLRNYPTKPILPILEAHIHSRNYLVKMRLIEVMRHNRKKEFIKFLSILAKSEKEKLAASASAAIEFYRKQGFSIPESNENE